jgi:hypothetical protein
VLLVVDDERKGHRVYYQAKSICTLPPAGGRRC